jgi:hypothetical protein
MEKWRSEAHCDIIIVYFVGPLYLSRELPVVQRTITTDRMKFNFVSTPSGF